MILMIMKECLMSNRSNIQKYTVYGSIGCILLYTWFHTGAVLQSFSNVYPVGYIAAAGIELAIVAMSFEIGQRKRDGNGYGLQVFVLVAVLAVSALANIYEGYSVTNGSKLSFTIFNIDVVFPLVLVVSTGLLSIIVFALSEIVSSNVKIENSSKENKPQLLELVKAKLTASQIAEQLDVSRATVYNRLKKLGLKLETQ